MNPRPNWWEHSGEAVNLENCVQANYGVFLSEPFFTLFKGVKRLFLSFNVFFFNQELTDKLARHFSYSLENLQIDYLNSRSWEESRQFRLALRNLRTFCYSKQLRFGDCFESFIFSLDCDRLTHLYANTNITFERDSFIARVAPNLRVLFANWITYKEESLEFPNLELLLCCNAPGNKFLISNLPSLKEFHFASQFTQNLTEARHLIGDFLMAVEKKKRKLDVFWLGLKFNLDNLDRNLTALGCSRAVGPGIESKTLTYLSKTFKENSSMLNFNYTRYTGEFTTGLLHGLVCRSAG